MTRRSIFLGLLTVAKLAMPVLIHDLLLCVLVGLLQYEYEYLLLLSRTMNHSVSSILRIGLAMDSPCLGWKTDKDRIIVSFYPRKWNVRFNKEASLSLLWVVFGRGTRPKQNSLIKGMDCVFAGVYPYCFAPHLPQNRAPSLIACLQETHLNNPSSSVSCRQNARIFSPTFIFSSWPSCLNVYCISLSVSIFCFAAGPRCPW